MPLKEKFSQAMSVRTYILSPWKLLFKKKVLYGVIIFILAYWILPPSVTKYADMVVAPVWNTTRAIAAEIGLFGLVKNTAGGVSATVDFIQGPDEIENSQGGVIFYAGAPAGVEWRTQSSGNLSWAMAGDANSTFQYLVSCLKKDELNGVVSELESNQLRLLPLNTDDSIVEVDKRDMGKAWRGLLNKIASDLSEMDVLWSFAAIERDEQKSVQQLYCLLVDEFRQEVRVQAFAMPRHADAKDKVSSFLISVDELEEKLKLDLLAGLEDELENQLEAEVPEWAW